jgi:tetratricopeptide (TPR) repeat protein
MSGNPRIRTTASLTFIALAGLAAYANTFHVPLQWDDVDLIADNPLIRSLKDFLDHGRLLSLSRSIGFLTFAFNREVHGLEVTGYHAFNLAVHIANGALVFMLFLLTSRTSALRNCSHALNPRAAALLAGTLFIAHPVQTEAVTYIYQRVASLCAFFSLLSLVCYIRSRLAADRFVRHALFAVSVLVALLAMKTKENAVVLPLLVLLYEFVFFDGPAGRRLLRLAPLLLAMLILPPSMLSLDKPLGESLLQIGYGGMERWAYFLTQFRVLVTYTRVLFLPVNQNLVYDYPLFDSPLAGEVLVSAALVLSFLSFSCWVLYRSRRMRELRPAAYGLLWFFISLSVESSVIPLPRLIDEYRLYLPSVGIFMAVSTAVSLCLRAMTRERLKSLVTALLALLVIVFIVLTYSRNAVWRSEAALWEDVVSKSPLLPEAHFNLGSAYSKTSNNRKALKHLHEAWRLSRGMAEAHNNAGTVYFRQGLFEQALSHFKKAASLAPRLTSARFNLGMLYLELGEPALAVVELEAVIKQNPKDEEALRLLKHTERLLHDRPRP